MKAPAPWQDVPHFCSMLHQFRYHDCPSTHKGIAPLPGGSYEQRMTFCSEYKALHDKKAACGDDELITLDEDRNNGTNM